MTAVRVTSQRGGIIQNFGIENNESRILLEQIGKTIEVQNRSLFFSCKRTSDIFFHALTKCDCQNSTTQQDRTD